MTTDLMEAPVAPANGTAAGTTSLATRTRERPQLVVEDSGEFANLLDTGKFEHMYRVAQIFASSKLVPALFQGKPQDCFVAIQMAIRLKVDPFMFLQNTYPGPGGKPGMEAKLAIALINSSGLFKGQLRFELTGNGDDRGCVAWAIDRQTDERIDGPRVSIKTAKDEGWHSRNPKWKNIPDLMLQYRAGAWFGRLYCPERLMGMQTVDELHDVNNGSGRAVSGAAAGTGRTHALLEKIKPVTSRPVSENQQFEEDPEAGQRVAAQDAADGEIINRDTGEIDTSGSDAEPPRDGTLAPPDVSSWPRALTAAESAAQDAEMAPGEFANRVGAWLVGLKLKTTPEKTTTDQRAALVQAIRDGRLTEDGKIVPAKG